MAVPKKHTSAAKKRIRKNVWKGKGLQKILSVKIGNKPRKYRAFAWISSEYSVVRFCNQSWFGSRLA